MSACVMIDKRDLPEHARFLNSIASPASGRVVCEITPGQRTQLRLAQAVLTGLGKDTTLVGAAQSGPEGWQRAQAWLAGEQVEDLIVARAQLLPRGHWELLLEAAEQVGARLWLLVQGTETSRGQRELIRDEELPSASFDDFSRSFAAAEVEADVQGRPAREPFPTVPADEFPGFLARCQEQLAAHAFCTVEDCYLAAYREADQWAASEDDERVQGELEAFVKRLLRNAGDLNEMLVSLRAAQAALLMHGWLLGVDRDSLAAGHSITPRSPLDSETARRLRRLERTDLAALGVIALASVSSPPLLARLNLRDVAENGDHVAVAGEAHVIPECARGILRAHRIHRRMAGGRARDPLFVSERAQAWRRPGVRRTTSHGIQQRLRQIALETAVAAASREGWYRSEKRWLKRRGIELRKLQKLA